MQDEPQVFCVPFPFFQASFAIMHVDLFLLNEHCIMHWWITSWKLKQSLYIVFVCYSSRASKILHILYVRIGKLEQYSYQYSRVWSFLKKHDFIFTHSVRMCHLFFFFPYFKIRISLHFFFPFSFLSYSTWRWMAMQAH